MKCCNSSQMYRVSSRQNYPVMGNPYVSPISRGYLWVFSSPRIPREHNKYHGYTVGCTPNCPLSHRVLLRVVDLAQIVWRTHELIIHKLLQQSHINLNLQEANATLLDVTPTGFYYMLLSLAITENKTPRLRGSHQQGFDK